MDGKRLDLAGADVERVLRHADGRGRLDARADDERHAARDAAENAAGVVGGGADLTIRNNVIVVILAPPQTCGGKARAEFHALAGGNGKHQMGKLTLDTVKPRFAHTGGQTRYNGFQNTAHAVALRTGLTDRPLHGGLLFGVQQGKMSRLRLRQQQTRRAGRVIDAIWNQYPRFTELEVRSHLARFGYRGEEVFKDCATLSGGEMARLRFAELALERPNLMFLDEPTNHLDIFMRETLTDALSAYTGTLLLVTHDRYLMQTLGCPILYLEDGKATFYPNFAALQNRDNGKTQEQQKAEDTVKKQAYGKEQRKRRAEVRARIKAVENQIEELGAHIVELENEINDPEVLRDHLLLRDKCDELDDTRFHQQELYDEWEKLAEEQDRMDAESDS